MKRYMETGAGNREAAIEAAGKAVTQVERTAAIIKSLRDLIRLGRSEIAPQSVQRIVRETVELLEPNLPRRKVEIKTRIPKDLPLVLADLLQVEQVLLEPGLECHRVDRGGRRAQRRRVHRGGARAAASCRSASPTPAPALATTSRWRPSGRPDRPNVTGWVSAWRCRAPSSRHTADG